MHAFLKFGLGRYFILIKRQKLCHNKRCQLRIAIIMVKVADGKIDVATR